MFIDLDKFKMINDTYDHNTGNAVLIAVADRMCKVSRKEDSSLAMATTNLSSL